MRSDSSRPSMKRGHSTIGSDFDVGGVTATSCMMSTVLEEPVVASFSIWQPSDGGSALRDLAPEPPKDARQSYREATNRTIRRLLQDLDFARAPECTEKLADASVCDGVDRIHDFYQRFGVDAQKPKREIPAPCYLRFDRDGPPLPGSLRSMDLCTCTFDAAVPKPQAHRRPSVGVVKRARSTVALQARS